MTDSDDKLSRRYRELAREAPSAELDATILAASRRSVENRGLAPGSAREDSRKTGARPQWMVPVSIAAVLVLGIGVSLRMQLEQPGVETSVPASSAEYPVPPAVEQPAPATTRAPEQSRPQADVQPQIPPQPKVRSQATMPSSPPAQPEAKAQQPLAKRSAPAQSEAAIKEKKAEPNPFTDAPIAMQAPPGPASPPAVILAAPAMVPAPPPSAATAMPSAPAEAPRAKPSPPAPAASTTGQATMPAVAGAARAPQAAPPRAKREAFASDNAAARESRALGATADPDPVRELERIARMREAGRHEDADRALAEFRRRHPDYRIPEPVWERVKPR